MKVPLQAAMVPMILVALLACGGEPMGGGGGTPCAEPTLPAGDRQQARVAYSRGGETFLIDADGCDATRADEWVKGKWSPGGERVAFEKCEHADAGLCGNYDIYVISPDGSELANLTNHPSDDSQVTWSPDGERLAFVSGRDGDDEIYLVNSDGSGLLKLTENHAFDFAPAWAPDGFRIAFQSDRDGNDEVYSMKTDGSDQVNLTKQPGDDILAFVVFGVSSLGEPWSPDGKRIAFRRCSEIDPGPFVCDIYSMNADGSEPINLTDSPARDLDIAWSPDGSRIAFASDRKGEWEIYVINSDGSGLRNLTQDAAGGDTDPVWSPDGKQIAYDSLRDGRAWVYMVNAEGGEPRPLVQDASSPAWVPVAAR